MILVFDLEGPLSPMDHAAEAMRIIGNKLEKPDFFDLFQMLSLYDDELTIEDKPGYNPGDTLRLIAPIISTQLSEDELVEISDEATMTPGAKDLIASLDIDNVHVASTSYQQHAHTIAKKLGIKLENVNCTQLPEYRDFPYLDDLLDIFEGYKKTDIATVKRDLDGLFWGEMDADYLKTKVCGGQRKMDVVESVSVDRGVDISEFVVVGDSITDINMLEGVKKEGGLAISFNGNQYSAPKANLAVSAMSLMAIKPLVDNFPDWKEFVEDWSVTQEKNKLLEPETKAYFEENNLKPRYDEVRQTNIDEVVAKQKEMRVAIRKEYGELT
jgi:energy-converting hydrogenase A subunit R